MTPALVLSVIAVVLAAAGGAVAAGSITGKQIKDSSITGKDVKNRSLTPSDFKGSVRGPQGVQGAQGPQGPAGPSAISQLVRVEAAGVVSPGDVDGVTATCPPGVGVVSGGYTSASADGEVFASDSFGSSTSWTALLDNFDSSVDGDIKAIAYCSASGQAASPRAARASTVRDRLGAAIDAQRARHK